ncbi:MAG: prefoldin subunit beta [SAR324 cluster bacterium]|jgi:prefoldin beta subunit|nr:prefoldin subunit beta [SAR324 cluster bacterium]
MTEEKMSPDIQDKLREFQEGQQQARMIMSQKYQAEIQLKEAQSALEELEKTDDKSEVHKIVGQILIKTDKATISGELKEKVDSLEVRMKSLSSQEEKLTNNLKSIQDRLQGILPGAPEKKSE